MADDTKPAGTGKAFRKRSRSTAKKAADKAALVAAGKGAVKRQGVLHEPTNELRAAVEELASVGTSHENICLLLAKHFGTRITDQTLEKHYADELRWGAVAMDVKLQNRMCTLAMEGSFPALAFLHATRRGIRVRMPRDGEPMPGDEPANRRPLAFTIKTVVVGPAQSLDSLLVGPGNASSHGTYSPHATKPPAGVAGA